MEKTSGLVCFLFSFLMSTFAQLAVDNSVVDRRSVQTVFLGEPEIECLSHAMTVRFVTKSPFQGHSFVRSHYSDEDCHKDYVMNQENSGFMDLDFDKCGMRRQRTANPKGMTMSAVVVVSFHRSFITHIDKAFHISCFYLEEEKIVTQSLEVSMLPTTDLDMNPPMPTCTYQVLADGPNGDPITFARIGDKIFHKWSCEYPMPDMYCMIIHSCTVDNGEDDSIYEVIDQDGCAKDPVILGDLTYITDLMAGTEAQIFKFADRANVFFTCQVSLSLKNEYDSGVCPKPKCGAANSLRRFRFKRDEYQRKKNLSFEAQRKGDDFDLIAQPLTVLDIEESGAQAPQQNLRTQETPRLPKIRHLPFVPAVLAAESDLTGVCLSEISFGVLMAAALLSCLTTVLFAGVYCVRSRYFKS